MQVREDKRSLFQPKYLVIGLVLILFLSLPAWAPQYLVFIFLLFFLYMALAQMWNLLAGYSGLVSLGQQIFIGLGGYMVAVMSAYYGMNVWVSILLGGLVSTCFALIISAPIFRMRGEYFAIATWVVAETLHVLFSNWPYVRSGMGFFITASYKMSTSEIYYASLVIGVGSVILVFAILSSRFGLGLMGMRDNEVAAETAGVKIFPSKLLCFVVGAFVTGIAGAVFYIYQVFIQPDSAFGINWIVAIVFIVIIGGIGTIEGPMIGSIIYVLLQQFLFQYIGVSLLILGAIAIVVILVSPKGIWGTVHERLGVEFFSLRRR